MLDTIIVNKEHTYDLAKFFLFLANRECRISNKALSVLGNKVYLSNKAFPLQYMAVF